MIFLSFAPDFNFTRALRHLFAIGAKKDSDTLKIALQDHYQGKNVQLYHNGRTAIAEAIKILVPKGSDVAINGLTCYAVPQAIKAVECTPIYIDINSQNFNFDTGRLREALEKNRNIRAIVIQNHLGLAADIKTIEKLARKHSCLIIEDLAHCAGSHYSDGREVGTVGDASALSFGKGKAIDTTQGGALILRRDASFRPTPQHRPELPDCIRDRVYPITGWLIRHTFRIGLGKAISAAALKTHIISRSSEGAIEPYFRLTHWQAKLALKQIENLKATAKTRAKYASDYGYPKTSAILRIPFLVKNRNDLLKKLRQKGIHLDDSWYDIPVSPKRYYHKANFPEETCPTVKRVADQMLNLPLLPPEKLKTALEIINPELTK